MHPIYLDANATTPLAPEVAEAMRLAEADGFANPASQHGPGRKARRLIEQARETIATILGARVGGRDDDCVIFTSGGTESNNLALRGLASSRDAPRRLIVSSIEHHSVRRVADALESEGWTVDRPPTNTRGVVEVEQLANLLATPARCVSVMLANHETGVLQPIDQIATLCDRAGAPLHVDASQAVGKIPVDFTALHADALSFSAHKFHGPKGIGGLIVRRGAVLSPLMHGGFQQSGSRPGTEPVALIVGMARALELFHAEGEARAGRLAELRDRFQIALTTDQPNAVVFGASQSRVPNVVAIAFPSVDRQALVMALDQAGVACSTGSACASGSSEPSTTLTAMGVSEDLVRGSVRFSLSAMTTAEEVDEAARRILKACKHLRP